MSCVYTCVYMYVYVCVYIYIYIYTYTHIRIYLVVHAQRIMAHVCLLRCIQEQTTRTESQ